MYPNVSYQIYPIRSLLLSSLCQYTQSPYGSHGSNSHDSDRIASTHHHPSSGPGYHLIIHHQVITFIKGTWSPIPPISNIVDLVDLEGGVDSSDVDISH